MIWFIPMFFVHYLKVAIRNLRRTKLFSVINILGLSIGMATCLLILHYVNFERSYDRFHKDSERIYRLRYERTSEDGTAVRFASCCPPAVDAIRDVFPEVETIARIFRNQTVVSLNDQDVKFTEDRMYFVEHGFFQIFHLHFIEGDPVNDIRKASMAFISRSTAEKYFGASDPIGKTLNVGGKTDFKVAGVFEDCPPNSHLKLDIILSYEDIRSLFGPDVLESWGHTGFFTYIRFKEGTDSQAFQNKMPALVEKSCGELMRAYKVLIELKLQRLDDIHLTSHFMQEYEINGNRDSVNFLMIVAVFIVFMAWINYINLSTAHALTRSKEVGLRKVVGASRRHIITQLFFETLIINLIAITLAVVLVQIFLPSFSRIAGTPLVFVIWEQPLFWISLSALFLGGIFLSGLYPVAAISSFQPAEVLKGSLGKTPKGMNLRKILVVFQFVMALVLLTGTFAVSRQIFFMKNQPLGFDRDHILVVNAPRIIDESSLKRIDVFKEELLKHSGIQKMCVVTEVPGRQIYWDAGAIHRAGEDPGKGKNYQIVGVDYDYLDVFQLKLLHGRNFSKEFPSDNMALILNETAVRWMGFESSEAAVGQQVDYWGEFYTVIGVFSDFHQQSPKQAFEPHIYRFIPYGLRWIGKFAIKIDAQNEKESITLVGEQYARFFPENPYEYFFLDDYFNQQYRGDELFGRCFFPFIPVCYRTGDIRDVGLFGIATYQRGRDTQSPWCNHGKYFETFGLGFLGVDPYFPVHCLAPDLLGNPTVAEYVCAENAPPCFTIPHPPGNHHRNHHFDYQFPYRKSGNSGSGGCHQTRMNILEIFMLSEDFKHLPSPLFSAALNCAR
jgi:putative ABC transport system permease protein